MKDTVFSFFENMNKPLLRSIGLMALGCCLALFAITVMDDFYEYHSIMGGTYNTPWYSESILKQPYTNLRLAFHHSEFKVETNACGSQIWVVKETKVGDKNFWTARIRVNIKEKTLDVSH